MAKRATTYPDRNNVNGPGTVYTMAPLVRPFSRFDCHLKWTGDNGEAEVIETNPVIELRTAQFGGDAVLGIEWSQDTPQLEAGTFNERTYDEDGDLSTREDLDPGYGPVDNGRRGKIYSFVLTGAEYHIYETFAPAAGRAPIQLAAAPASGFPFPFYLRVTVPLGFGCYDIMMGGSLRKGARFSVADQIKFFGSQQSYIHLRMFQDSNYLAIADGIPTDVDF